MGTDDGQIQVTTNATSGAGTVWNNRTASNLPGRFLTMLAVDPVNSTVAYAVYSGFSGFTDTAGHVFKTTNTGVSWTDISANLPNIPVNDIVVDPDKANTLDVATDIGVFSTSNNGLTWVSRVNGLPRSAVLSMKLHRPSRTLRALTFGRGGFDLSVP